MSRCDPARLPAICLALFAFSASAAEPPRPIRLGLISDMSGPSAANNGPGTAEGARFAIEDAGGSVLGRPVELLTADHQNKVDVGMAIVRHWIDQDGVGIVLDTANSAIALGVQSLVRERNKIVIFDGSMSSDLTNKACSPNGFHWVLDTYSQTHAMIPSLVNRGEKTWFFITADYAFGLASEKDATAAILAAGGKVLGSAHHPIPTDDFSSYLLTAQASNAQVIGIANAVSDLVNTVKQAHEFGVGRASRQDLATFYMMIGDVKGIGLADTQGVLLTDAFYWDQDDGTRAFAKRFFAKMGFMPNELQAGMYSAVAHYLKAVRAAGTDETGPVLEKMRALPVEDFMTHGARIREDGRLMRDLYLFRVKSPEQSKAPWDFFDQISTIPAIDAFRPRAESLCDLLRP